MGSRLDNLTLLVEDMAGIDNLKDIANQLTRWRPVKRGDTNGDRAAPRPAEPASGLRDRYQQLSRSALDLLFPMQCLGCGKEDTALCADCAASLPRLTPPFCRVCAQPEAAELCNWCAEALPPIDGIRSLYLMEGVARESIHSLKYRNVRTLAPYLSRLMAQHLRDHPIPGDLLVPVPLHPKRLRDRGYNQAGLLAQELSKLTGLPVDEDMMVRSKNNPSQVRSASREQRQRNVKDSFHALGNPEGRSILLIDDVATTGSTLFACANALKRAGAGSVWGLTLAKEP